MDHNIILCVLSHPALGIKWGKFWIKNFASCLQLDLSAAVFIPVWATLY